MHTAVKIDQQYPGPVVYVKDASRAVGVAQNLVGTDSKAYVVQIQADHTRKRDQHANRRQREPLLPLAQARINRSPTDWAHYTPPKPNFLGIRSFDNYPLEELVARIDWTPFFHAWELRGRYPAILDDSEQGEQARHLFADAQAMLDRIITERWLTARGVIGFFPANRAGEDDIALYADETRNRISLMLHHLRQQSPKPDGKHHHSLADWIAPRASGVADYLGAFAVTTGIGIDERIAAFERAHDDYRAILLKALADRLAESFAERLHERVRKEFWGYAADEVLSNEELIAESYRGIRPAPGYPACPDHTEKGLLWELLDVDRNAGIHLTESFAMTPTAAVSGWYFSHPEARYFGVGRLDRDQVADYAQRKGWTIAQAEKWLAPNLGYEPEE